MRARWESEKTYARVEADGLCVDAQVAELDQLLELDGQGRHDAGSNEGYDRDNRGVRLASNTRSMCAVR